MAGLARRALAVGAVLLAGGGIWSALPRDPAVPAWAAGLDGPPHPDVVPDLSAAPAIDSPALPRIDWSARPLEWYPLGSAPGAGSITGRVATVEGRPVASLAVTLLPDVLRADRIAFGLLPPRRKADPAHAVTDGGGRFGFSGLPLGRYRIRLDRHPFGLHEEWIGLVPAAPHREFNPAVAPYGTVTGVIVDRRGFPVEDAGVLTVALDGPGGTNQRWGVRHPESERGSDPQGRFSLRGLPVGRVWIAASSAGRQSRPVPVEVRAGATVEGIRLVLPDETTSGPGRIAGTVRLIVSAGLRGPEVRRVPESSVARGLLEEGDLLATIDGRPTLRMSWVEFVWSLGGAPGSPVRLGLVRRGAAREVALARQPVGAAREWL
ncbi:hypothetical protein L6R50_00030 [Myxococcota bacterium]|nr:hypothetical protein [Myxococcota bacterium]